MPAAPSRLRVLLAGPDPTRPGGVRAVLDAVAPHLGAHDVQPLIVGRRSPGDVAAPLRDLREVRRLRGAFDLLHLNPSMRVRALTRDLALARAWSGPVAAWLHGWDDDLAARIEGSPIGRRALDVPGLSWAVLAPPFADRLAAMGVPLERITVVPPPWTGRPLPRAPEPRRVLFLGRVEAAKGVLDLVTALRGADARLVVAGEGSALPEVRALAERCGVALECPGWIEGEAKWRELARAEVLALPSRSEGLPVVLLEAMAAGLPALATPVGAVPWLEPEVAVVRGSLRTALLDLLDDPDRRQRMSRAGRARAADFTAEDVATRLQAWWTGVAS